MSNNNRGKNPMNLTHSNGSNPPLQMHNFMPMSSSYIIANHDQSEADKHASSANQWRQNVQSDSEKHAFSANQWRQNMQSEADKHASSANQWRLNMQSEAEKHAFSANQWRQNVQSEAEKHASSANQRRQNMQSFWTERLSELCDVPTDGRSLHTLPLARIKKVMKSDENVKMISADTPVVFAKACELFVMELTLRAWMHTIHNERKIMQRNDVAFAIWDDHILSFLNNMVPIESHHHEEDEDEDDDDDDDGGVYIPVMSPMYMQQSMNTEAEVVPAMPPYEYDRHFVFPMNLQHHDFDHAYLGRTGGMQNARPPPPPPSPLDDGPNPYLTLKAYLGRTEGMQLNQPPSPPSPPPSPFDDGPNPYLSFKDFFQ